ncbi:hypoxanthine phosphoribosyltransferase [Ammonifex thiophilus]|uniref:Hypoxanthine phosphoribosyltransferase n=1 Tax=Ammonifex thiophilus TaxID=444093 RepID=A0A3D8P430_9THEO|nr:hypoxanthine phosphoribosyltransferase [Ammonifex thiophilus]RDV83661.1 hypoxanthine phosphoribosyltransferase [Ammonifex thiophilus]
MGKGKLSLWQEIDRVLISREEIAARLEDLAGAIASELAGGELLVIGVLKGAVIFLADLVRKLPFPVEIDFLAVSSYGKSSVSSGVVRITKDLDYDITGKRILLVEDIVDTGLTLNYLLGHLKSRQPQLLKVCVLLDKPERRKVPVQVDYVGFTIPDEFVVGYGLDYAGRYRNLPDICVLKREVYQAPRA